MASRHCIWLCCAGIRSIYIDVSPQRKRMKAPRKRPGGRTPATARSTDKAAPVVLTANDLRRLADAADGQRGKTLELTATTRGGAVKEIGTGSSATPGGILLSTPLKNAARKIPALVEVTLPLSRRKRALDTSVYDLVVWGEAAAEKFLVPYYVRFYTDEKMRHLHSAIVSGDVVAIAHIYPSFMNNITDELHVLPAETAEVVAPDFVPLSVWFADQTR